jgi:hypothetical protein
MIFFNNFKIMEPCCPKSGIGVKKDTMHFLKVLPSGNNSLETEKTRAEGLLNGCVFVTLSV